MSQENQPLTLASRIVGHQQKKEPVSWRAQEVRSGQGVHKEWAARSGHQQRRSHISIMARTGSKEWAASRNGGTLQAHTHTVTSST